ncbi:MAG: zf-HC2 domain-containing protein, partial [Gammaproteobacteria bacterium]|nr:zf-HC2 domain-containing protein [Gammaproteobacteria bacterium]
MSDRNRHIDQHVGNLLSGFIDGELTQQQRQLVTLHCDNCDECRENLAGLRELRERVGT